MRHMQRRWQLLQLLLLLLMCCCRQCCLYWWMLLLLGVLLQCAESHRGGAAKWCPAKRQDDKHRFLSKQKRGDKLVQYMNAD
jgi:hypothetical protein